MEQTQRDPAARSRDFEVTYLAYHSMMLHLARNILRDEGLAEDAVSDALVKLYEHYDCLEAPTGPQTRRYAAVLTEHCAIDLLRRWKGDLTLPLEYAAELRAPTGEPEDRILLMNALNKLPNEQRSAVLLALSCGLTAKEVARTLDCSVSKAEKLISRGKKALRKELKEVYP